MIQHTYVNFPGEVTSRQLFSQKLKYEDVQNAQERLREILHVTLRTRIVYQEFMAFDTQ